MARIGKNKKKKEAPKKPTFSNEQLKDMDKEMKKAKKDFERLKENEPDKAEAIRTEDYMWLFRMKAVNVRKTLGGYALIVIPSNYTYYSEKLRAWKKKNDRTEYAKGKEMEELDKIAEEISSK